MLLAPHAESHEDDQAQATASDESTADLPRPSLLRASPGSIAGAVGHDRSYSLPSVRQLRCRNNGLR